jgi:hypothetical protein
MHLGISGRWGGRSLTGFPFGLKPVLLIHGSFDLIVPSARSNHFMIRLDAFCGFYHIFVNILMPAVARVIVAS